MRELLFDQDAEQETFQVSYGHQLSKFSPEDLESHRHTLSLRITHHSYHSITNYQLPITNYQLPITFSLLCMKNYV